MHSYLVVLKLTCCDSQALSSPLNLEVPIGRKRAVTNGALTISYISNRLKAAFSTSHQFLPTVSQPFGHHTDMPAPPTCGQNPPSSKDGDKPSGQEDLITLVHSLTQKVDTLSSTWARDLAKLATYCLQPPTSQSCSSAFDQFLQAPHCLADDCPTLLPNGSNYPLLHL
ncbi:hypothetical protein O181_059062 [Austropuccinia psidii MF-1]|uniref:Uncharacterized protein n=1 Tax=Austropuccinia psidii MF-1 TaxID=1389203 RepID=A0A9Q3EL00_9BASI|nr:hypothetical protein [Austropuccinia psidii MF-1]